MSFTAIELCAGGGGQALGLEMAGFRHLAAVEYERQFCETLRRNRPKWNVLEQDIRDFDPSGYSNVDLLAAGVPCPPFSIAGKQLGKDDERDLFPTAMEIVGKLRPRAVMFENVRGFAAKKFESYRRSLISDLSKLGYTAEWKVLQAADFGVPQLRPRFILVALNSKDWEFFEWPIPGSSFPSVGDTLIDLMEENGWKGAKTWAKKAQGIAPTIVGGSKKHGGPDLGPTRAKRQWKEMGVDGMGIANEAPPRMYPKNDLPRLTVRMAARIQSFPDEWEFAGKKTVAYRQVGNAFPPLVACALGLAIRNAFLKKRVLRRDALEPTQMRLLEGNREKKKYGGKKRIKAANSRVPASK